MYLGDIEVFRTSTAEPTRNGIVWTYIKEMNQYTALWKTEQKIIFDLGNLVNEIYTGTFNASLTATFFTTPDAEAPADVILPISARQSSAGMGSAFSLPSQNASVAYELPRNVKRAVISLSTCGQSAEEFWYSNVFSSEKGTFEATTGTLYGYSPFREVQLLIDGRLAGVSWPFPVIFTGGISPGLWRPIAGIDAFDLREHEIDVTPWLPLLCDGASHSFEIRVVGLDDDGAGHATLSQTVGSYWVVSGKIFLFLDVVGVVTIGSPPEFNIAPPKISISSSLTTNATGANETLTFATTVTRDLSISSTVINFNGSHNARWTQHLSYRSSGSFRKQGLDQSTRQNTTGSDESSSGYLNIYEYPLEVNSSFFINEIGGVGIAAAIFRSLTYNVIGSAVFPSGIQPLDILPPNTLNDISGNPPPTNTELVHTPLPKFVGAFLSTTQTGSAGFLSAGNRSYSYGVTEQDFSFKGAEASSSGGGATYELYRRHVRAVNSTVTDDSETFVGRTVRLAIAQQPEEMTWSLGFGGASVRRVLGRGPGKTKEEEFGGGGNGISGRKEGRRKIVF